MHRYFLDYWPKCVSGIGADPLRCKAYWRLECARLVERTLHDACPECHGMMKKNGSTSAGRTRWRCKDSQEERRIPVRSLRRANTLMWSLWPPVPLDWSVHDVVHLDGIHLHRKAAVPVPVADGHAVGRHMAGSETRAAWPPPLSRIAPPPAVVRDSGGGVLKALRTVRPSTRVQRCLFHACMNITEPTGLRPRLEAGKSPRKAAVALPRVPDADPAAEWPASYNQREQDRKQFLGQKSHREDGTVADQHRRLAKACRMIRRRIREGHLFTFVEPPEGCATPILPTNNLIESWNARIRDMLRRHRGLSLVRQIKAVRGGATSTPGIRNPTCGSRPTPSWTDKSRRSTGKPGNAVRWVHGGRQESQCDTAPALTGKNSTPPTEYHGAPD